MSFRLAVAGTISTLPQVAGCPQPQGIGSKKCFGEIPHSVVRENFPPALTEQGKPGQRAISFGGSNGRLPMQPCNCAMHLDNAAPPDDRREPSQILADLVRGSFANAKRHQSAGVPEGRRLVTVLPLCLSEARPLPGWKEPFRWGSSIMRLH